MKKTSFPLYVAGLILGLFLAGCGGGGSSNSLPAPTTKSKTNVAQHLGGIGAFQAGAIFATFGHGVPEPAFHPASSPVFVSQLGLWMVLSVSGTTFTETFYADQAETQPAGNATYTLDVATLTLSGAISITKGPYAGLSGTYSQTLTKNGTTGTYSFTLPSGLQVSCSFTLSISATGIPSGTGSETVTETNGYSETANVTYLPDGSKIVTASDSNGYKSTLKFASDGSGTGTISGPDPGLPATIVWNSVGTGTVTFVDGITLNFTNWQIPNP
jgi:hypothetical protein